MQALTAWIMAAMALAWALTAKIPGKPTPGEIGPVPKDIAEAIAKANIEHTLFSGSNGERQGAATMTGIARFESGFRQVYGDCKDKPPGWPGCGKEPGARVGEPNGPQSFCFMQVHLPNGAKTAEGWTGEDLMADPLKCAQAAREIIRKSILASPAGKPLLQYAGRFREAETRWNLAQSLYKSVPPVPIKCDD
jgi:hypothetical protein